MNFDKGDYYIDKQGKINTDYMMCYTCKAKKGAFIMAFYDWNKDGKKDFADDYIEYNIYKECTKDDDNSNSHTNDNYSNNNYSNNSGCGVWGWISITFIVIGLLLNCGG